MKMTCSIVILEKSFYNKESIFEIYIFFPYNKELCERCAMPSADNKLIIFISTCSLTIEKKTNLFVIIRQG